MSEKMPQYIPSQEEIKKAEDSMTPEQKAQSEQEFEELRTSFNLVGKKINEFNQKHSDKIKSLKAQKEIADPAQHTDIDNEIARLEQMIENNSKTNERLQAIIETEALYKKKGEDFEIKIG